MGMNIEDVLGNVKEALIKAAKEGKKKGITECSKKSVELINNFKTEINTKFDELLNELNNMSVSDNSEN